jgi:hypothetical protein
MTLRPRTSPASSDRAAHIVVVMGDALVTNNAALIRLAQAMAREAARELWAETLAAQKPAGRPAIKDEAA